MTRRLKVGMAMAVVVAMSAIGASGAEAHYVLTPGANPAILTGEQIAHPGGNYFEIGAGVAKIECKQAHGEATIEGISVSEVTSVGSSSECTTHASGINAESVVDANGCDALVTGETGPTGLGLEHLKCPAGKVVEITTPSVNCTIKIHEQTPTSGGVTYENVAGTPDDIVATGTIEGITFERSGGILCAASGIPSEGNNAKAVGKATIRAYKDEGGKEGAQVNLTVS